VIIALGSVVGRAHSRNLTQMMNSEPVKNMERKEGRRSEKQIKGGGGKRS